MPTEEAFTIQPLGEEAAEVVQWVVYTAVGWNDPPGLPPLEIAIEHPEIARYHRGWGRPGDFGVIAETNGDFAGAAFARLFTDDDHGEGFVDEETPELAIAVAEHFRRRGVGRLLMVELADEARRHGISRLALSVNDPNPARSLYGALGYRTIANDGTSSTMVLDL
jgi:GNAT superfamily N-acetyltransferase